MTDHRCPSCHRSFETELGLKVHHNKIHGESLPNRVCVACDSAFYSKYERKYCSEECRTEAVSFSGEENPNYTGGKTTTSCEICGSAFKYYPSEKEGKYCPDCVKSEQWRSPPDVSGSDHPKWKGGKQTVTCDACGTRIKRWPHQINGRTFCDVSCQGDWLSENFIGSDHPNWEETEDLAYGPGWETARERALSRDRHCCQVCGADRSDLGQNPDVHHVTPVRWFVQSPHLTRSDAHTLSNLVSLCRACHRDAENGNISKSTLRSYAEGGRNAKDCDYSRHRDK